MRLAAALLALACAWGSPARALERGAPAPEFSGTTPSGADIALQDYRGKVVWLDFWASWCGPCRQSFPWMDRLQRMHGDAGLAVVAVNVDEDRDDALRFLSRHPVGFAVVTDAGGAIAARYDVQHMPSSYLIDRRGTVRAVHHGFNRSQAAKLEAAVVALLKEAP